MSDENKDKDHKDTIEDATGKASLCFSSGKSINANPYRNVCGTAHNAKLYAAFEDAFNSLHFEQALKGQKSCGVI